MLSPAAARLLFPPPDPALADLPALRHKGDVSVQVLTVGGQVELRRRYFWSKQAGGVYPADTAIGIESGRVSPGAKELCCTMGVVQDFAQGAGDLHRLSGLRVSKERLRQITEREARQVEVLRREGTLPPTWSAPQSRSSPQTPSRVYLGADGVKVRAVTQAEKDQRRRQHAVRRQQRGRTGLANVQPLPPPKKGSDDRFKEMKIGLFYDQSKTRVHAFATDGDHQVFGRLLGQHAQAIALHLADEKVSLTDGAPWIRNQILGNVKRMTAMLLDFYHLSEHIWSAARTCWGEGEAARAWAERQLHDIKHTGPRAVLAAIDRLRKKLRGRSKLEVLRRLRGYIVERWEMVDYRTAVAKGWDIGSGPTEAMCKNLTLRLKRTGMKWDVDHAAGLMNLIALRESGQWSAFWQNRQRAA